MRKVLFIGALTSAGFLLGILYSLFVYDLYVVQGTEENGVYWLALQSDYFYIIGAGLLLVVAWLLKPRRILSEKEG